MVMKMTSSKPTKVGSFHSQEKEKKMAKDSELKISNHQGVSYIVAYRFLEQCMRTLEKMDSPMARDVYLKLKDGKRELEDIIW